MKRGLHGYLKSAKRALRNRRGICLTLLLAGFSLCFAASFVFFGPSSSTEDSQTDFSDILQDSSFDPLPFTPSPALSRTGRPIFPYSIVPGGVHNLREVKEAISNDPTVAKHYEALKLKQLQLIRVKKAAAVYVSYRVGNNIYWTRGRLKLAAGETLLTDGENTVRTRCGNLISESPKPPNSPQEPTPSTFDTPLVAPPPPVVTPPLVLTGGPGNSGFFPPFVPLFPGDGPAPPKHHHPRVNVPEPGPLLLVFCGLALLWATARAQSR